MYVQFSLKVLIIIIIKAWGSPLGVVANMLVCDIMVSKFKLHLHYYVHIQTNTLEKGMNSLIPTS